jgi:hypothetical protein
MFSEMLKTHPMLARVFESEFSHSANWDRFAYLGDFANALLDWIDFTMQTANEAAKHARRDDPSDELSVYAGNVTRWASHELVIHQLLLQGRYGECQAIFRMVLEQTDLIVLLTSEPSEIADWVKSTGTPGKAVPERWQPRAIRGRVDKIGAKTYDYELYAAVSAAVHPSYWGNSMYAARLRGATNRFVMTPMATFDPVRGLEVLGLAMRVLPLPAWQFIRLAERRDLPSRVQQSFRDRYALKAAVWAVLALYQRELHDLLQRYESDHASANPGDLASLREEIESLRQRTFENAQTTGPDVF